STCSPCRLREISRWRLPEPAYPRGARAGEVIVRSRRSLLAASMLAVVATLGGCRVGGGGDAGPGMPDSRLVVRCNTTDDGDGDGIYDELETGADFDGDGTPNYLDDDSDGDGFLDRDEHGDPDGCVARDTDGDGLYDF